MSSQQGTMSRTFSVEEEEQVKQRREYYKRMYNNLHIF